MDTLVEFERLIGTAGADRLTGGFEDDFEEFDGRGGADTIDGGSGFDQVSYQSEAAGVTVDLAAGTGIDGLGATDSLTGIEAVEGSAFADSLTGGDPTSTTFERFRPRGGNDTVDGGAGFDEVDYLFSGATAGVDVDLAAGTADDGLGGTDTLLNIEAVRGTQLADTFLGDGADNRFRGYDGADTIDGAGGFDEVDYSNAELNFKLTSSGVDVDLAVGTATDGFGKTDILSNIEAARGTKFDDSLTGDAAANDLFGGDGADTLVGGAGADFLDGGDDTINGARQYSDTVDYSEETGVAGVTVNLGQGTGKDSFGARDTLTGLERVIGTAQADRLTGGSNTVFEEFDGRGGGDTIDGKDGFDQVSYRSDAAGVSVNLASGSATDGLGGTDTLSNIEAIEGSEFADSLLGDTGDNRFRGLGGADTIDGVSGFDEVDYLVSSASTGVSVDLAAKEAIDHTGATDSLVGIEAVRGTSFDDTLLGDALDNQFRGNDGGDTIDGRGGEDTVDYRDAADTSSKADDGVSVDLAAGSARDSFGRFDTLSNIENAIGTRFDDTLIGDLGDNSLTADDGSDTLVGGDGADTLAGGDDKENGVRQFFDTVDYSQESGGAGVSANLATGSATDSFGKTDTLSGIERVIGTSAADTLTGGGDDGFEEFDGRGGADTIDGGTGFDQASYQFDAAGITVQSLVNGAGTVVDGSGSTDTLSNIDSVEGSEFADTMTGGAGSQRFRARAGNDTIDGGADNDEVDYLFSGATAGAIVDLVAGTGRDGLDGTDTLVNIERIRGTVEDDTLLGDGGANRFRGHEGNDSIDGRGGVDLVDYANAAEVSGSASRGVYVDLAAGTGRDGFGDVDRLANIEQVRGTKFADTLIGDTGDNLLEGGDASDTLVGGDGADTLDGGADVDLFDTVDYSRESGAGAVSVDLGAGSAIDSFGKTDTLTGLEWVIGTGGADTLTGGAEDGFEEFIGLGGNDIIDGATGFDQVSYQFDPLGITVVALANGAGSVVDGFGDTDTLTNIDSIEGSELADSMTGGAGAQRFRPRGGADTIDGGAGVDEVDYRFSGGDDGATVDLASGTAVDPTGATDTLSNIENVRGSDLADHITGDAGTNRLRGVDGDDTLVGGGGADTLEGGSGRDTFIYNGPGDGDETAANDTPTSLGLTGDKITDFESGSDRIELSGAGFTGFSAGDEITDGVNFFIIGTEYDGTNAGPSNGDPRIVVDGAGNLIVDSNGDTAGYSLLANVAGDQAQASDLLFT